MPFLNEYEEPVRTVESIYNTCNPDHIDIIAIDDGSTEHFTDFRTFPNVNVIRNPERTGVAACRQQGAELVQTPNMMIIDGHMRFKNDNWLERITSVLEEEPKTILCTTCVALSEDQMDIQKATTKYYGADILLEDASQTDSIIAGQILEPKWATEKPGNEYDIACILGANYAGRTDWINKLWGFKGLQKWGGDEVFLSLKNWMAGGKCKLIKDIEIGHKFRNNAPYTTLIHNMYYNKMWICHTILPNDLSNYLLSKLPHGNDNYNALIEISSNWKLITETRKYYESIFSYGLEEICERLGILIPGYSIETVN